MAGLDGFVLIGSAKATAAKRLAVTAKANNIFDIFIITPLHSEILKLRDNEKITSYSHILKTLSNQVFSLSRV